MPESQTKSYSSSLNVSSAEFLIQTDQDLFVKGINNALLQCTPKEPAHIIGHPIKQLLAGLPEQKLAHNINPFYVKATLPIKEKKSLFIHWLVIPDTDDQSGKVIGYNWIGCEVDAEMATKEKFGQKAGLIDSVSDCIIATDLDSKIVTWNRAAEEVYGFSYEEMKGKRISDVVKYEYVNDSLEAASETLARFGKWQGEVLFERADGIKVYLFSSVSMMKDESGNPYGKVAVNRNITDRVLAEGEFKRSEYKFRNLTENAPTIILRFDKNLRFIYANQTFRKFVIIPIHEIMGKTPEEAGLHGEPLLVFNKAAKKVFKGGRTEIAYLDIIRKNGLSLYLHTTIIPEFVDEKVESLLVICSDITDIKRKEEELKSKEEELLNSNERFVHAAKATTDAIWELNLQNGDIYVSEEFVNKFGYTAEELKSKPADWYIIKVREDERQRVLKNVKEIFSGRQPFWRDEFHFLCKDGSFKYILVQASIMYDLEGKPFKAIGAIQDLSARKEVEAELIRKEKLLSAIAFASNQLVVEQNYNKIMEDNLTSIAVAAEADRVTLIQYLYDLDTNSNYLSLKFEWFSQHCDSQIGNGELSYIVPSNVERFLQSIKTGDIYAGLIENVPDPWLRQTLENHKVKSILTIPIISNGQFWGMVDLQQCVYGRVWSQGEIDIFKTFVFTFSAAIERNEAYKKLQDSEEKFKALFKNSLDIVFVLDDQFSTLYVTPGIEKILGYVEASLADKRILDFFHPEDVEKIRNEFSYLMHYPEYGMLTTARVRNDRNEWVWMEVKGQNQLLNLNINGIVVSLRDITERQIAQERLSEYSDTITAILNSITDGFAAVDKDFRVKLWNTVAECVFGIRKENIVGRNLWSEIPALGNNAFSEKLKKALVNKITLNFEQQFLNIDRWFDVSVYPYDDGLFIYFKDVTEKKKQEMLLALEKNVLELNSNPQSTLKDTVDYFLEGIEKINQGVFCSVILLDESAHITHLSAPNLPAAYTQQINGIVVGDQIGSCGTAMFKRKTIIVEDISSDPLWKNYKDLALSYDLKACWSLPIYNSQDKVMGSFASYYKQVKSPTTEEFAVIERAANLLRVIIENKKAEEQVRISNDRYILATRATNEAIWDWDIKTDVLYCGDGFYTLFGYPADYKVNTETFWSHHIHPDDRLKVKSGIQDFITKKSSHLWIDEYRYKHANGNYCIVLNKGYLIYNSLGEIVRMVGSIEDVTEKKRLEKKLIKQEIDKQKLVAQAIVDAQEKERAEIGKELHDNVNQILSTAKLLLEVAKTNPKERSKLIKRSAEQIHSAINEIRTISRSLVPPSISDLGLSESIKDLLDNIAVTKTLKVDFVNVGDIENGINDNQKLMLFRIIQEQVSNVLRHSEAKHLSIELRVDKIGIELAITDDGKGFDPEKIKTNKGVGLSNIASRVELFNGKVNIISAPGKGCRLIVNVLPIQNNKS